jgi:sugar fermentation stimulation protein A
VLFVVHWPFAQAFMPDYHTDLYFAETLVRVHNAVEIIPVAVRWSHDLSLEPNTRILPVPWQYVEREAHDRGSYLIVLQLSKDKRINVGKLGTVLFKKGFYVYVGSAMANLTKRIERHKRYRKTFHWHIDFLRDSANFIGALAIRSSERLECDIASSMSIIAQWSVKGFGSSDCTCGAHLFGFTDNPVSLTSFQKLLQYFRMDRYRGGRDGKRSKK